MVTRQEATPGNLELQASIATFCSCLSGLLLLARVQGLCPFPGRVSKPDGSPASSYRCVHQVVHAWSAAEHEVSGLPHGCCTSMCCHARQQPRHDPTILEKVDRTGRTADAAHLSLGPRQHSRERTGVVLRRFGKLSIATRKWQFIGTKGIAVATSAITVTHNGSVMEVHALIVHALTSFNA